MTENTALGGMRVLDLSQGLAGAFAARLLGDFGADVIKIEVPRTGDYARYMEPLVLTAPDGERSLLFQYVNWNKRGITLDISADSARPLLQKLVASSDIIIESFKPGTLKGWGLDFDQLIAWNPNIVLTSISPYGQTGPYAEYDADDLTVYAMSGIMSISGSSVGEPLKHGLNQSLFCAGINAAYASLAAHTTVTRFGGGEHVDLSIAEVLASELVGSQTSYAFRGAIQGRPPPVKDIFAGDPLQTKEGFLTLQQGGGAPAEEYATLFGREEFRDPEMRAGRGDKAGILRGILEELLQEKPATEWFKRGTELRLLVGMVQGAKELLTSEQLEFREFFWEVDHPATGKFKFPGELVRLSATPAKLRRRSPLLGEHTQEILGGELGVSDTELKQLMAAGVV
jgi:crotonobetainyl-CoA:carnitine CoA-transferase CaiB-like acyl-CoA transferase